jgi:hypothetical protein
MATAAEAVGFLLPDGGYVLRGENYEDLEILSDKKITKAQFLAAFSQYDQAKAASDLSKATAKEALLTRLGITADEAKLLLS